MPRSNRTNETKAPAELDLAVARTIRELRNQRGMSQAALGDAIGVTFQQVQKYEAGKNRISASRLQKIADVLSVPVSIFFSDDRATDGASAYDQRTLALAGRISSLNTEGRRAVEAMLDALERQAGRKTSD